MSYAHPEYLVETDWVASHSNDPKVRISASFVSIRSDAIFSPKKNSKKSIPISASATTRPSSFTAISPIGSHAMRCGSFNTTDIRT